MIIIIIIIIIIITTSRFSLIADLYPIYALINASQTKYHSLSDLAEQEFRLWM